MDVHIRTHSKVNALLTNKTLQHILPIIQGQFRWQRNYKFSRQSAVLCFLYSFGCFPKQLSVFPFFRCILWEKDFTIQTTMFSSVIVGQSIVIIIESGTRCVSGSRYNRTACATAHNFCFQMEIVHYFPPSCAAASNRTYFCDKAAGGRFPQAVGAR